MPDEIGIGAAARLLGVSASHVRALTGRGVLSSRLTPGGHRRYDPELLLREWERYAGRVRARPTPRGVWARTFPLAGLAEDLVWAEVRDTLNGLVGELPPRARAILGYAVSEMVNNAIDHSMGSAVAVELALSGRTVTARISDDGVGAFARMAQVFDLPDPAAAVVEITKGKRTTAPERHSGEGIFFTSKAVDVFELAANGFRVVFDNLVGDVALGSTDAPGTQVVLRLDLDTARVLGEVFREYTDDDGVFDRTTPRIALISHGAEFISRSEAKRFAVGLEKFDRVVLDFAGVELVGQGFADELFRVWQNSHPDIRLEVVGASPGVSFMIGRVGS